MHKCLNTLKFMITWVELTSILGIYPHSNNICYLYVAAKTGRHETSVCYFDSHYSYSLVITIKTC